MEVKFRRQHPIWPDYDADVFCAAAKLVIEAGGQHACSAASDAVRDAYMRRRGLRVVRVPAADVLRDAHGTADAIMSLAARPLHHPAVPDGPPPRSGQDQR
jgi:very-short-patch-repair endonuclease